jgi:WD40 repeat protein
MADVFISYSRKEKSFVERLDEALRQREREAWVDWEGIRPTEEFMKAIYGAIEGADTFIFVLSPDSIASEVCRKEIEHALAHNKRMVPIVARDVDAAAVPEALAKLNWIFFRETDDFQQATDTLIDALETDLDWIRAHTRLLTRAVEWESKKKNRSLVLRGDDLREAERWLAEAASDKERNPTALQTDYIIASRKASARRLRITLGAVGFGAIVAIVLAIIALIQRGEAVKQEKATRAELSRSEYLRASSLVASGDADQALQSLATAVEQNPQNREAMTRLVNLLGQRAWPQRIATLRHAVPVSFMKTDDKGERLFVAGDYGVRLDSLASLLIWDVDTLEIVGISPPKWAERFSLCKVSPRGDRVLSVTGIRIGSDASLHDAKSGAPIRAFSGIAKGYAGFSSDGKFVLIWFWDAEALGVFDADSGEFQGRLPMTRDVHDGLLAIDVFDNQIRTVNKAGVLHTWSMDGSRSEMRQLNTNRNLWDSNESYDSRLDSAWFAPGGEWLFGTSTGILARWGLKTRGRSALGSNELIGAEQRSVEYSLNDNRLTVTGSTEESRGVASFAVRFTMPDSPVGTVSRDAEWRDAFSPVRALSRGGLAIGAGARVILMPFLGGVSSGPLRHSDRVVEICELNSNVLASGAADGEVKLWRIPNVAFSPSVTRVEENQARESRPEESNPPSSEEEGEPWDRTADGAVELRGEAANLWVRHTRTGRRVTVALEDNGQDMMTMASLAPDGKTGVFSAFQGGSSKAAYGACIFSTEDGRLLSPILPHSVCSQARFTADGKQVFTVGGGQIVFWDAATFQRTGKVFAHSRVSSAGLITGGQQIVSASEDGSIRLWDLDSGTLLHSLDPDPSWKHSEDSHCPPAVSQDGRRLAAAYATSFVIWDLASGRPLSDPIACGAQIRRLEFRDGGSSHVAAELANGTTIHWDQADVPGDMPALQRESLTQLARAIASGDWAGVAVSESHQSNGSSIVTLLREHFAREANAIPVIASVPAPQRISTDAVHAVWLHVAKQPIDPFFYKQLVDGLREVQKSRGPEGAKEVEAVVQEWKRIGWHKLEDHLVANVWGWTSGNDSGRTQRTEFDATLELEPDDPLAAAAVDYWNRYAPAPDASERLPAKRDQRAGLRDPAEPASRYSAEALAGTPSPKNRLLRAQLLAMAGELNEALNALNDPAAGILRAGDRETEAALLLAINRPDSALAALDAALAVQPDRVSARLRKAKLLLHLKRQSEFAEFTTTLNPEQIPPATDLAIGDALIEAEQTERALAFYQTASFLSDARLRLAAIAWRRGDNAIALRYILEPPYVGEPGNHKSVPAKLWDSFNECLDAAEKADAAVASRTHMLQKPLDSQTLRPPANSQTASTPKVPAEANGAARIADAEAELNRVYARLRNSLSEAEQRALKREELDWIKWKDELPANSKQLLEAISDRTQVLQKRLDSQKISR